MPEPSSDPRRIIAVVVTYNRRDMVTRLVASLDAGSVVPDEVVVVDNASIDGTADALEAAGTTTPLTVLRLTENTGGAGGFHTGLAAAIERSEGKKSATKTSKSAKRAPAPSSGTTGGSIGNIREGYAANQATDLSAAC